MFFLTLAAVAVAAGSQGSSFNRKVRRDFRLEHETVEERLHALIESDTQYYVSGAEDKTTQLQTLQERSRWLIRVFEIGLAKDKKMWVKKRDTLRFFRENSHVFNGHTDYVSLANRMPVVLESIAEKLSELGYEPLNTLQLAYTVAFTDYWLGSARETQLETLREAIRPAKLTNRMSTSTTTTSTTSAPVIAVSSLLDLPDSDEDMTMEESVEEVDSEEDSPGEMNLPMPKEVVAPAGAFSRVSVVLSLFFMVIVVLL